MNYNITVSAAVYALISSFWVGCTYTTHRMNNAVDLHLIMVKLAKEKGINPKLIEISDIQEAADELTKSDIVPLIIFGLLWPITLPMTLGSKLARKLKE